MGSRGTSIRWALAVCAAVEAALLIWLLVRGESAFFGFVTTDDSGYTGIARHLVEKGYLPPSTRTMGYPLVLALGYLAGGARWGVQVIVGVQLALNLVFAYGAWRLIERIVGPAEGDRRFAALAFLIFFVAGLGMALQVMTDFLAAFFFFVFLYGMLFWRRRVSLWLSAPALALATLTRPTFTFLPLVLPFIARTVGRVRSPLPRLHLGVFIAASLAATGVSIAYQHASYGYLGPSSVMSFNLKTTLYHSLAGEEGIGESYLAGEAAPDEERIAGEAAPDEEHAAGDGTAKERYLAALDREIERRAGRPHASLSKGEEERIMRGIFFEALRSHPGPIAAHAAVTFAKYLFVPIESLVSRFWALLGDEGTYRSYARVALFVLCLPLWVLFLIPPVGSPGARRAYWAVTVVMLVYVLALSVVAPAQGERMRFAVLAFMLPVMVWNAGALRGRLARR